MVMEITFVALNRKTWDIALHDIYQVGDSDNVDTFKEYVRNRRTHANDIIEQVHQAYLLLEPIPGGNTLHTLRTMDWRQIFENHGTPLEDEDLSSESMPVREDDITVIFLCVVKSDAIDMEQSVNYIQHHQEAPSIGARNSRMLATQKAHVPNAIYNGRPLYLTGPSLTIFHPIFSKFKAMLAETPKDIPDSDLDNAYIIVRKSVLYYPTELDRQSAIESPFRQLLHCSAMPTKLKFGSQQVRPDMHKRVEKCGVPDPNSERQLLDFIGVLKNNTGSGNCDPMDQAAKIYESMAVAPNMAELRKVSCLPTFLLSIMGPQLSLSGSIFLNGVVTKPLIPPISLIVPDEAIENATEDPLRTHVRRLAHLLLTLRTCLQQLEADYAALSPTKPTPKDKDEPRARPAPHLESIDSSEGHGQISLTYEKNAHSPRYAHAVFYASAHYSRDNKTVKCVVKFTKRYNAEAHRLMAGANVTAELIHCKFEPTVGMFCVITSYVSSASRKDVRISEDGVNALQKGLELLHAQSLAFGDLRDANIILDEKGWPHVIDFDWCGTEGTVHYPFDLNTETDPETGEGLWVDDVKPGGLIKREHDRDMLRKHLAKFC